VSFLARADGVVVVDDAHRVDAAGARARILTGASNTSLTDRAIAAQDTFRTTRDVWIADVVPLAGAGRLAVEDDTLSIGSARIGIAGILWQWRWEVGVSLAQEEGITDVSCRAVANGVVVFDHAVGVYTARAWARVLATLSDTSEVGFTVSLDGALWSATLG
jgi:hypothetical protein